MKKFLLGTAATAALMAIASPASAQTAQLHYADGPVSPLTNPTGIGGAIATALNEGGLALNIGTRYRALAGALPNTTPATPVVTVAFSLSGTVQKDCSFYAGNSSAATTLDFGVIGVRTGNNENVNSAFEMVGPAVAAVDTLTAGCNFNNEVKIVKANGTQGMVNPTTSGYDSNQFQKNIPYSVNATWTGVPVNTVAAGSGQTLNVADSAANGALQQGAWRSRMDIDFVAPAITAKGLVAGAYSDTATLTLTAL
jgi:hypothetical protein